MIVSRRKATTRPGLQILSRAVFLIEGEQLLLSIDSRRRQPIGSALCKIIGGSRRLEFFFRERSKKNRPLGGERFSGSTCHTQQAGRQSTECFVTIYKI